MAFLKIHVYGDPVLRERAEPVKEVTDEIRRLVSDMIETMYIANGVGLAANQVGELKRLLVLDVDQVDQEGKSPKERRKIKNSERNPMAFLNPEILETSPEDGPLSEGCLSLPGLNGEVFRPKSIRLRYEDLEGQRHEIEADGFLARVLQHEIDHLNGVMFVDRIDPKERRTLAGELSRLRDLAKSNPDGIAPEKVNP